MDLRCYVSDGGFPQRRFELLADLGESEDGSRRRAGGGRVRAEERAEGVREAGEASVCVVVVPGVAVGVSLFPGLGGMAKEYQIGQIFPLAMVKNRWQYGLPVARFCTCAPGD